MAQFYGAEMSPPHYSLDIAPDWWASLTKGVTKLVFSLALHWFSDCHSVPSYKSSIAATFVQTPEMWLL